jgi:hypothetical protein
MITRLRLDAGLYAPAPPRRPKQKGAPRKKGKRLPTLEQRLHDRKTRWQQVTIPQWYGEGRRRLEIVSGTALWYHSGQPVVPLRWVLIRDPQDKFKPQALSPGRPLSRCALIRISGRNKSFNGLCCAGSWK